MVNIWICRIMKKLSILQSMSKETRQPPILTMGCLGQSMWPALLYFRLPNLTANFSQMILLFQLILNSQLQASQVKSSKSSQFSPSKKPIIINIQLLFAKSNGTQILNFYKSFQATTIERLSSLTTSLIRWLAILKEEVILFVLEAMAAKSQLSMIRTSKFMQLKD